MKIFATAVLLIMMSQVYSQDSTQVDTPIIVAKLLIGDQFEIEEVQIRFSDVINDSRCPKYVDCIRAGEAKVLVEIYKADKYIETKTIEITPTTHLLKDLPLIFNFQNTAIKGFNLLPYPEHGVPIKKEDYIFQLVVKN